MFLWCWSVHEHKIALIYGGVSELPARCTHYVYIFIEILLMLSGLNDLVRLPVIHRLDSSLPPPLLSSNRRFMTQGDDMHQAMFGAFRAPIMCISSESNFSPQLLPHTYAPRRYSMSERQGGHMPYTHLPCLLIVLTWKFLFKNLFFLYNWFLFFFVVVVTFLMAGIS